MKKFFALLAFLFLSVSFCFSERILSESDFYEPWIIGTWGIEVGFSENGEQEAEYGIVKIDGCKPESTVFFYEEDDDDPEIVTLAEFVEEFFENTSVDLLDMDEDSLDYLRLMGAKISGDAKFHLNDSKDAVSFLFGASVEDESILVTIVMKKIQ